MKLGVVANPTARAGTGIRLAEHAIEQLRARASQIDVHAVEDPDAARTALLRMRAQKPDAAVVVGGDGTVHMAANVLAGSGVALGIVPVGTGNDFATANGIPSDPQAAADTVFDGQSKTIDLGEVTLPDGTTRYYATVLACGFDSKVGDRANRMRWPRGRARYNLAIAIEFAILSAIPLGVSWFDEHGARGSTPGPLMLAAGGNTARYGGGIPICPNADAHDGLLDLTLVAPAGRGRLVRVLAAAFKGEHGAFDDVVMQRVREFSLEAPALSAYADGELLGPLPVRVRAVPDALTLRVPLS